MLIRITESCQMACKHCFISATPNGEHMSFETFMQAVRMATTAGANMLVISGGEPTDHPQYLEFMRYLEFNYSGCVSVVSHGGFIDDDEACEKYLRLPPNVFFQITNDSRYYPKALDRERAKKVADRYPRVVFSWELVAPIYPQGRARRYLKITEDNAEGKAPKCFNLRSITCSPIGSFDMAIRKLETIGKFCTPSVGIDGSIGMGESNHCPAIGKVTDTMEQLTEAVHKSLCNECGMMTRLSPLHKAVVSYRAAEA